MLALVDKSQRCVRHPKHESCDKLWVCLKRRFSAGFFSTPAQKLKTLDPQWTVHYLQASGSWDIQDREPVGAHAKKSEASHVRVLPHRSWT